jgi:putative transposase
MRYTSDVRDAEWALVEYCFPQPLPKGRRRKHPFRELLNAIFYLVRTSCQWRNLPKDFAPWKTVYHYFRLWTRSGLLAEIHHHLREHARLLAGRKRQPTAAIIDSQSVKSSQTSGERGYDAAKKIVGRKRHLLVDTLGLMLMVLVLPADVQDRDGARQLLQSCGGQKTRLKCLWADKAYAGALVGWVKSLWRLALHIVERTGSGFQVQPRRWVIERTFGWLVRFRRLSRDYERKAQVSESMVYLAMIRLMLARIAR